MCIQVRLLANMCYIMLINMKRQASLSQYNIHEINDWSFIATNWTKHELLRMEMDTDEIQGSKPLKKRGVKPDFNYWDKGGSAIIDSL